MNYTTEKRHFAAAYDRDGKTPILILATSMTKLRNAWVTITKLPLDESKVGITEINGFQRLTEEDAK